jgi:hypothetical protein
LTARQSEVVDKLSKGYVLAYCKVEKEKGWWCLMNAMDEFIEMRPDVARNMIHKRIVICEKSDPSQTNYVLNPKVRWRNGE